MQMYSMQEGTSHKIKHFINLTNGIEYYSQLPQVDGFIRLQSTACEQKRWSQIICDLDYSFLMWLVLGYKIMVYDCSAKKDIPRALWQGIPFIRYVLERYWNHNKMTSIFVRDRYCTKYFSTTYEYLSQEAINKLKYFKSFTNGHPINIEVVSKNTENDGNKEYFKNVLIRNEYDLSIFP